MNARPRKRFHSYTAATPTPFLRVQRVVVARPQEVHSRQAHEVAEAVNHNRSHHVPCQRSTTATQPQPQPQPQSHHAIVKVCRVKGGAPVEWRTCACHKEGGELPEESGVRHLQHCRRKFTTTMNPRANTTTRSQAARTRNEQGDHWSLALPNQLKDMMQVGCATWPTMLV